MSKNTTKPKKPYKDFPMFAHATGQWAKIRGKLHYFGSWDGPDAALKEYLRIRDDLQAGRTPTLAAGVVTLSDVCNAFLQRAGQRRDAGEITSRTFTDYLDACKLMTVGLGRTSDPGQLQPTDFTRFRQSLTRYAPSRMSKIVGITRMVLRWAYESELIDSLPRFGPEFRGARKRRVRQHRAAAGSRLFEPSEIKNLIDATDPVFQAMILCGINGRMGNTDVSTLPLSAVEVERGWVDFPRPKSGIARRFPLWPETAAAVADAIEIRPEPVSDELADRVFLTHWGNAWVPDGRRDNQLSAKFRKLLQSCGLYRKGLGFYSLRHTFQTIGDEAKDPLATAHIMGHTDGIIGGVYRERISDERLRTVVDHVRDWLWAGARERG